MLRLVCCALLGFSETISFNHWNDQPYTKEMILSDFSKITSDESFRVEHGENLSIEDSSLTFRMLKDKVWVEGSGAQVIIPITPRKSLTLEYLVYFDGISSDYEWTTGGKLPGVSGGRGYTGGESTKNGDGFSARLMFGSGGKLFAYIYHADMEGKYGESLGIIAPGVLKQNSWNHIKINYRINTEDLHDGAMAVWANGSLVGERSDIRFCTKGCLIDKFLLVSFHGGQTPDYKPSKEQKIRFKSFKLSWP